MMAIGKYIVLIVLVFFIVDSLRLYAIDKNAGLGTQRDLKNELSYTVGFYSIFLYNNPRLKMTFFLFKNINKLMHALNGNIKIYDLDFETVLIHKIHPKTMIGVKTTFNDFLGGFKYCHQDYIDYFNGKENDRSRKHRYWLNIVKSTYNQCQSPEIIKDYQNERQVNIDNNVQAVFNYHKSIQDEIVKVREEYQRLTMVFTSELNKSLNEERKLRQLAFENLNKSEIANAEIIKTNQVLRDNIMVLIDNQDSMELNIKSIFEILQNYHYEKTGIRKVFYKNKMLQKSDFLQILKEIGSGLSIGLINDRYEEIQSQIMPGITDYMKDVCVQSMNEIEKRNKLIFKKSCKKMQKMVNIMTERYINLAENKEKLKKNVNIFYKGFIVACDRIRILERQVFGSNYNPDEIEVIFKKEKKKEKPLSIEDKKIIEDNKEMFASILTDDSKASKITVREEKIKDKISEKELQKELVRDKHKRNIERIQEEIRNQAIEKLNTEEENMEKMVKDKTEKDTYNSLTPIHTKALEKTTIEERKSINIIMNPATKKKIKSGEKTIETLYFYKTNFKIFQKEAELINDYYTQQLEENDSHASRLGKVIRLLGGPSVLTEPITLYSTIPGLTMHVLFCRKS